MNTFFEKQRYRLLPVILILFILEIITFPFVIKFTRADKNTDIKNILTYTSGKLTWSSADSIGENGSAEISLFNTIYNNSESGDGSSIIAPGTEGEGTVRLKNSVSGFVKYTAVLYTIKSSKELPVSAALSGDNFTDTDTYILPDGVTEDNVIRAVSGTLGGGSVQDFNIEWNWEYGENGTNDAVDTLLGNYAENDSEDNITVGIYIVVEDGNSLILPPNTDAGNLYSSLGGIYVALMFISAVVLVFLIIDKIRNNKKCE